MSRKSPFHSVSRRAAAYLTGALALCLSVALEHVPRTFAFDVVEVVVDEAPIELPDRMLHTAVKGDHFEVLDSNRDFVWVEFRKDGGSERGWLRKKHTRGFQPKKGDWVVAVASTPVTLLDGNPSETEIGQVYEILDTGRRGLLVGLPLCAWTAKARFVPPSLFLPHFDRELTKNTRDAAAYEARANYYRSCVEQMIAPPEDAVGAMQTALNDYRKSLELEPKNTSPHLYRGVIHEQFRDYEKARQEYQEALKIDPRLSAAYNNIGNTFSQQGEYDKAVAAYTKAIEVDPNNIQALIHRANTHFGFQKFDEFKRDMAIVERDARATLMKYPEIAKVQEYNQVREMLARAKRISYQEAFKKAAERDEREREKQAKVEK